MFPLESSYILGGWEPKILRKGFGIKPLLVSNAFHYASLRILLEKNAPYPKSSSMELFWRWLSLNKMSAYYTLGDRSVKMAAEPSYLQPLRGPVTFVPYKTEPIGNARSQALYLTPHILSVKT
jgi:hypothetical protein